MKKRYKTKEFADLCGVTVRTLQYYDKVDLLSPSYRSSNGFRLYSSDDLLPLQQILIFKGFGFSLREIRQALTLDENSRKKLISAQASLFEKKADHYMKLAKISKNIASKYDEKEIDEKLLLASLEVLNMSTINYDEWFKKYFSENEYSELLTVNHSDKTVQEYNKALQKIRKRISENLTLSPSSEKARELVNIFFSIFDEVLGDSIQKETREYAYAFW